VAKVQQEKAERGRGEWGGSKWKVIDTSLGNVQCGKLLP